MNFLANLKSCTAQTARLAVSNPAFPLWRCGAKVGNSALKRDQTALKVILFKKMAVNNKFATKFRGTLEPFVD